MATAEPRWKRLPSYRVAGALSLAIAVLLLLVNELAQQADRHATALRDGAAEARLTIDNVRRLVLTMESSERGYMLTARPDYRKPYDSLIVQAPRMVQSVRELAAGRADRRDTLEQLATLTERKLSELAEIMRLFEKGDPNTALNLLLTDIGREQSEGINALVDAMLAKEAQAYISAGALRERIDFWRRVAMVSMVLASLASLLTALRLGRERERDRARHLDEIAAERDKLEVEVERRTAELTSLARYLQTVQESERGRLARELHDELGGLLTAAKLDVARIRKRMQGAGPEVNERIDHLGHTLDAGIALKRRIIEDLRPSSLDHLGLPRALEVLCGEFGARSELAVRTSIEELRVTGERALALYRVVQEALTNVAKYAGATELSVSLKADAGRVRVVVGDNGRGFDPAAVAPASHGLAGMRFRMQSCGGDWRLRSAPGRGTTIEASVPA